jgi:sulfatase modifying factor 1
VLTVDLGGGQKMEFVRLAGGKFFMGSPEDDEDRAGNERRHEVEITRPFYMGRCAVTVGQFRAFQKAEKYVTEPEEQGGGSVLDLDEAKYKVKPGSSWKDPGFAQDDNHPVVIVSWNDARAFCKWLGKKDGKEYRLPTEAEREYACRGGTTTRYWTGDSAASLRRAGNFADAALTKKAPGVDWTVPWDDGYAFTAPVDQGGPNPFGLYGMHGNVWDWCQDCYAKDYTDAGDPRDPTGPAEGTLKVIRGGSWCNGAARARSAARIGFDPKLAASDNMGFRVVRVP